MASALQPVQVADVNSEPQKRRCTQFTVAVFISAAVLMLFTLPSSLHTEDQASLTVLARDGTRPPPVHHYRGVGNTRVHAPAEVPWPPPGSVIRNASDVDVCEPLPPTPAALKDAQTVTAFAVAPEAAQKALIPSQCRGVHVQQPLQLAVVNDMALLKDTPYMEQWLPSPDKYRQALIDGQAPRDGLAPIAADAAFIARVPRGAVCGSTGGVFNENMYLRHGKWYYGLPSSKAGAAPRVSKMLSLVQKWSNSAQHFMFDTVPRMDFITPFLRDNPDVKVLMSGGPVPRDVVARVWKGIVSPSRIVWARSSVVYPANTTYLAHFYKMPGFAMGAGIGGGLQHIGPALRSVVWDGAAELPLDAPTRNKVLYIGRQAGRTRSVLNETAVLDAIRAALLPSLQLEVHLDPHSLTELTGLGQAVAIVGPHGGALGNIAYLPPGAGVVEFIQLNTGKLASIRPCYAAMAHAFGLQYQHVEPTSFSYDKGCMAVQPADVVDALHRLRLTTK